MGTATIILRHLIPALQSIQRELADLESKDQASRVPQTVLELKAKPNAEVNPRRRLLNLSEAAEFLRVSKSSLYRLTSTKRIPHYNIGSRILLDEAKLIEWIGDSAFEGDPASTRSVSRH